MTWIKGVIKFQKKVIVSKQECYGCCRGDGDQFDIRISQDATENFKIFAETLLHELIHLWMFIIMATIKINITEKEQHIIMKKAVKNALGALQKYYDREVK